MQIDGWLLDILACPECHAPLRVDGDNVSMGQERGSHCAGLNRLHLADEIGQGGGGFVAGHDPAKRRPDA